MELVESPYYSMNGRILSFTQSSKAFTGKGLFNNLFKNKTNYGFIRHYHHTIFQTFRQPVGGEVIYAANCIHIPF
jgi:hypothetical protein